MNNSNINELDKMDNKIVQDLLRPIHKDEDLVRIKSKIEILNNMFKQGTISIIIRLFISWLVTLELSNGIEKITIQEILLEVKRRLEELNKMYDELAFGMDFYDDPKRREKEKKDFRERVYKLFDLGDLIKTVIGKCVSMGSQVNRLMPLIINYIHPYTILLIDSLLLTDTADEFEKKMGEYVTERVISIEDPIKRKLEKIRLLNNMLKQAVDEPIDMTYYTKKNIKPDQDDENKLKELSLTEFIELTEIVHKKD
jgi:hypothetical protein